MLKQKALTCMVLFYDAMLSIGLCYLYQLLIYTFTVYTVHSVYIVYTMMSYIFRFHLKKGKTTSSKQGTRVCRILISSSPTPDLEPVAGTVCRYSYRSGFAVHNFSVRLALNVRHMLS